MSDLNLIARLTLEAEDGTQEKDVRELCGSAADEIIRQRREIEQGRQWNELLELQLANFREIHADARAQLAAIKRAWRKWPRHVRLALEAAGRAAGAGVGSHASPAEKETNR